jgi:subtilisin family serine protease
MKASAFRATVVCVVLAGLLVVSGSVAVADQVSRQKGSGRNVLTDSQRTSEVLVFLERGTDARRFADQHGLVYRYALRSDINACVFEAASPESAETLVRNAHSDPQIRSAYLNEKREAARKAFVPNDPYFDKNPPWYGQWHLKNEYTPGLDARVEGAWNRDITGLGVTIGIVDDGVETTHPDLSPNYVAADSWDFGQNDPDPNPVHADDVHGVAVAGVAAARGGNGIGVTGAAPHAGIAGLRVDFENQTVAQFVDATLYHSSGTDTSIKVKNHSYGYGLFQARPEERNALEDSTAAGTIHVWAAGNDWSDANKLDLQNHPAAITVAAMGSDGKAASYSNFGANVFVTAPSNPDGTANFRITTTDRTGTSGYNPDCDTLYFGTPFPDDNYTAHFGGTSSAAPVVAGVMALGKQVQPGLNTRFAKHLLVKSSYKVDENDSTYESDGGWKRNGAGNEFNQNYGFGLIDADKFTLLATQYSGVTPLTTESTGTVNVNLPIPDGENDVSRTFDLSSTTPLEDVLVTLDITHEHRGDLEAYLTSPENTTGRLMKWDGSDEDTGGIHWTFLTNTFWGENPAGMWTIMVRDMSSPIEGRWDSFAVEIRMGELVAVPEPATLGLLTAGGAVLLLRNRRRRLAK